MKYFPISLCYVKACVHVCFWGYWTRSAPGGHCFGFLGGRGSLVRVNLSEGHTWLLLPTVHACQEWDAAMTLALQSCAMDSFSRDNVDIRSMNVSLICLLWSVWRNYISSWQRDVNGQSTDPWIFNSIFNRVVREIISRLCFLAPSTVFMLSVHFCHVPTVDV